MSDTHARFWKCALQVNPPGYRKRHRGQDHGLDADAYAEALRRSCLAHGIRVVGLADHSSVGDVDRIRDALSPHGITVFPGFEVSSTEKVHMVCLFAEDTTTKELERVLGRLALMDPEERVTPSELGCLAIARIIHEQDGFWYAAHMTTRSGLLRLNQDGGSLLHIWKDHELVRAGQIPGPVGDLPEKYKMIVENRNPDYQRKRPITVINARDVAEPDELALPQASTFIKMTRPCFASFLAAFHYPESRVKLHDEIPERHCSRIESVRIEGGYFDGLDAKLSGHLDAVIGGRGTGKSTLIECLRYALDVPHKTENARKQGEQIVRENLGREGGRVIVALRSAANHMKRYRVVRRFGEPVRVIDENGNESSLRPGTDLLPGVEVYGQNEIHDLARSPGDLARILDRFLPQDAAKQPRLEAVQRSLNENGARLEEAMQRKEEIEERIARLPRLEERVRQFREQGLEEKLKTVPLLAKERQLEPRFRQEVERVREAQRRFEEDLPDLAFLSDRALEGLPHAELLREGRLVLETLDRTLRQMLNEMGSAVTEAERALAETATRLLQALKESEADIEKEFAKLPAMAGKSGREVGTAYRDLLREIEAIKPDRANLETVDALVGELQQTRRNLLGEMSDLRSERTAMKQQAIRTLNRRLTGKLRITIVPDGLREPLRTFLQKLPEIGPKRTQWVDDTEGLTVPGLVAAIREGKGALLALGWGITTGLAERLTRLSPAELHALESIDLQDQVKIELNIPRSGREHFRAMEQLSTGQQCTAILHLLLLDNSDPLIMDQPEDNLDNAFIAERIVKELLRAKTERQFLFATHNANIPVFGDAEWIGVCTASGDRAEMPPDRQGSIDLPQIRDQVAGILEGGREAFMQRREMYGFDDR